MKRKPKLARPVVKAPKVVQTCAVHDHRMTYKPEAMKWVCPDDKCDYFIYPEDSLDGSPILGKGTLSVIVSTDGEDTKYFLHTADNNVMVDISGMDIEFLREGAEVALKVNKVSHFSG